MPGESPRLAIVAIEGIERACDRGMPQAVRPRLDASTSSKLGADNVIDAGTGKPLAIGVAIKGDEQRRVFVIGAANGKPRPDRLLRIQGKRHRLAFGPALAEHMKRSDCQIEVADIKALDLATAQAETIGKPDDSRIAGRLLVVLILSDRQHALHAADARASRVPVSL